MAPPPEYDKEPKAPDKSLINTSKDDSKVRYNNIKDQSPCLDLKSSTSKVNTEVENNKHVETLDDGQLRALLDEAITYKCPKDREGKSSLFKELLEEVEQDEQCEAAARVSGGGRGARRGRGRHEHHSSLQDLVAAMAAEPTPRRSRHAHAHGHHAPPAANVSARTHHGGSLPSGVDTSFLLSEEPARGGYLATVRCVNPPPLAERRVSASDANPPADLDLLARRSKPIFPMTYTARATLEIGSGSVSSGRAVTTTTASNQVRTLPANKLLPLRNTFPNRPPLYSRDRYRPPTCGPPEKLYQNQKSVYNHKTNKRRLNNIYYTKVSNNVLTVDGCKNDHETDYDNRSMTACEPRGSVCYDETRLDDVPNIIYSETKDIDPVWNRIVNNWYSNLTTCKKIQAEKIKNGSFTCQKSVGTGIGQLHKNIRLSTENVPYSRVEPNDLIYNENIEINQTQSPFKGHRDMQQNEFKPPNVNHVVHNLHEIQKIYRNRVGRLTAPNLSQVNKRNIRSLTIAESFERYYDESTNRNEKVQGLSKQFHDCKNCEASTSTNINNTLEGPLTSTLISRSKKISSKVKFINKFNDSQDVTTTKVNLKKEKRTPTTCTNVINKGDVYNVASLDRITTSTNDYESNLEVKSIKTEYIEFTSIAPTNRPASGIQVNNEIVYKIQTSQETALSTEMEHTIPIKKTDFAIPQDICATINDIATTATINSGEVTSIAVEVDSAMPFSCITTPEIVSSCNTTTSTTQSDAVDIKPLDMCYRAVSSLMGVSSPRNASPPTERDPPLDTCDTPPALTISPSTRIQQPRNVISSSFNGLPLTRPNYGSTASTTDDYKKPLDENGNAVQGFSSPLSGSSQHKKPRRKKSSKNETVIKSHQIDGYQGNKDLNEVLRFIESNADGARVNKLSRKHKDDSDDKCGKKRSTERRKDKESKIKRATSMEELSRTKLEDLTDHKPQLRAGKPRWPDAPPAKPERRSWGDDARATLLLRPDSPGVDADPAPDPTTELTDFQTVTKKRKPRRRTDEAEREPVTEPATRRTRPPSPRARRISAPPSDRSNDSNDDMDSVHSLPADATRARPAPPVVPPPHASYADIARTRHNIPDLIESCNFYGEGDGDSRVDTSVGAVPTDRADTEYPALAAGRRARDKAAGAGKEREAPAPDVVADRRPPVILLDAGARTRDLDGVTFGFDVNEQLLGGARADVVRDAEPAVGAGAGAGAVRAGCAALRYVPPRAPPPHQLHALVDYVAAAWEDIVKGEGSKVKYYSD